MIWYEIGITINALRERKGGREEKIHFDIFLTSHTDVEPKNDPHKNKYDLN